MNTMKTAVLSEATVNEAIEDLHTNDYMVKSDKNTHVVTDFDGNDVFRALRFRDGSKKFIVRYDTKVLS